MILLFNDFQNALFTMFNSEENSPLLMADGGLKPKKRVSFHDNHFRDAYFGATAVFTKFPSKEYSILLSIKLN